MEINRVVSDKIIFPVQRRRFFFLLRIPLIFYAYALKINIHPFMEFSRARPIADRLIAYRSSRFNSRIKAKTERDNLLFKGGIES